MTLKESNEILNPKVLSLCDEARAKLKEVKRDLKYKINSAKHEASSKKKNIVLNFAKDLENKIRMDIISATIVKQLEDLVSESFIHECLDEKYKQKHKVENAKQQKKKKQLEKEGSNLDPLPALNQQEHKEEEEEEKQKDKVPVMVGADGQSYVQRENQNKPSDEDYNDHISKDKTFTPSFSSPQQQPEQNNLIEENSDQIDNESKDRTLVI